MSSTDLGPLDWRIAITDKDGRPTPEFQRRWNTQRTNNELIGVTLGDGPPVDVPDQDGLEYLDTTSDPPTLYVSDGGTWIQVGVSEFTQLTDVPASYATHANKLVQVNSVPDGLQFNTISNVLDLIGSTRGSVLYRGASGWAALTPGTSGYVLTSNGAGADPNWVVLPASGGTVTSVALAAPTAIFDVTGSPITTSGTITLSLDNQSANRVFAGPTTGAAATPTFRSLVSADIPVATTTDTGAVRADNTSITISGGVLSALGGGGGGAAAFHPGYRSDTYYPSQAFAGGSIGYTAPTLNIIYCVPFYVGQTTTFASCSIHNNSAAVGGEITMGIYNNANGEPTSLRHTFGIASLTTTGLKTATNSVSLTPGWYWLAMNLNTSSSSLRRIAAASSEWATVLSTNFDGITLTCMLPQMNSTYVSGVLPSSFTKTATAPTVYGLCLHL